MPTNARREFVFGRDNVPDTPAKMRRAYGDDALAQWVGFWMFSHTIPGTRLYPGSVKKAVVEIWAGYANEIDGDAGRSAVRTITGRIRHNGFVSGHRAAGYFGWECPAVWAWRDVDDAARRKEEPMAEHPAGPVTVRRMPPRAPTKDQMAARRIDILEPVPRPTPLAVPRLKRPSRGSRDAHAKQTAILAYLARVDRATAVQIASATGLGTQRTGADRVGALGDGINYALTMLRSRGYVDRVTIGFQGSTYWVATWDQRPRSARKATPAPTMADAAATVRSMTAPSTIRVIIGDRVVTARRVSDGLYEEVT